MKVFKKVALFVVLYSLSQLSKANVVPNSLFTSGGVLQQGLLVPVWGTARNGENIIVQFAGQTKTTVAVNGRWIVKLDALEVSSTPQTMVIKGDNTVSINNILVGEVWLCSGQSNMGFPLRSVKAISGYPAVEEVLKDAQNYPLIRQFSIPLIKSTSIPQAVADVKGKWSVCDSVNAKNFSAVAYFFGRELYKNLKVPIGLINSSYGGTAIENWMSKDTLDAYPELKTIYTNYEKAFNEFPAKMQDYKNNEESLLSKYSKDSLQAVMQHIELPRKAAPPMHPAERGGPGGLYNTMILPLIPYAIKGAVWYQGEANGSRGVQYRTLLPAMINNWRSQWNIGNFPFVIIQIPGWKGHQPELREAQLLTVQKIPNTAMVVITDVDDTLDVHPGNKQPVGERASLAARALAYKQKIEFAGPEYKAMTVEGNKIVLSFRHAASGLVSKGGALKDFLIAGADKNFVPAVAVIKGDKVVVSAGGIVNPVAVRLGWRLSPQVNLYNKEGLCATAFRTDIQ